MIPLIPIIVAGGVVKKFSDSFFGEPKKAKGKGKKARGTSSSLRMKANYPSRDRPF